MLHLNLKTIFYFTFLSLFLYACSPGAKPDKPEIKTPGPAASPYPPLSNEDITKLYSIAEKVDMIFYNLPISVNQEDAASAKNTVLYISPAPAIMSNPCKPLGRISWIAQGIIVSEADVYIGTGCQYMIFMKDQKPVSANAVSESGVQFFNQVLNQVQQRQK